MWDNYNISSTPSWVHLPIILFNYRRKGSNILEIVGLIFGFLSIIGLSMLIYRRFTNPRVRVVNKYHGCSYKRFYF